jgi:hypothetical protein
VELTIELADPRKKVFLFGQLGNATVNGLTLFVEEAEELIEKLEEALAKLELQ